MNSRPQAWGGAFSSTVKGEEGWLLCSTQPPLDASYNTWQAKVGALLTFEQALT